MVIVHLDLFAMEVSASERRQRLEAHAERERRLAGLEPATSLRAASAARFGPIAAEVRRLGAWAARSAPVRPRTGAAPAAPLDVTESW